ncbi:MAG: hypothetical protein SGPRY_004869, partial [Prymnesium sp.]
PCPIATRGFNALVQLVGNTCRDSFDLFYALYSHNPHSSDQLAQFAQAFDELRAIISLSVGEPDFMPAPQIAGLCGARSVVVKTRGEEGFLLQPHALERALTPATRILILCNPSNPTGAVHPPALLEELAAATALLIYSTALLLYFYLAYLVQLLCPAHLASAQIVFDEKHVAFASLPGMYERTVTINGFSKGQAMTGFRVGYIAASTTIAAACNKVQSQNTSCPCSLSQHAAIAAIRDVPEQSFQLEAIANFREKRDYVLSRHTTNQREGGGEGKVPGVSCETPQGAFYLFPTISPLFGKRTPAGVVIEDSEGLCLYLLEECHLALVPGEAFGDGNCLRISYAAAMECLVAACDSFERGVKLLK